MVDGAYWTSRGYDWLTYGQELQVDLIDLLLVDWTWLTSMTTVALGIKSKTYVDL